jgi:hypothetical protein
MKNNSELKFQKLSIYRQSQGFQDLFPLHLFSTVGIYLMSFSNDPGIQELKKYPPACAGG